MLRTPPHPGDPADRTERLLARILVTLIATRILPTRPAQAREAIP
jgi:hypothetical protein